MWISSFVTDSGEPRTGLSPTIKIREVATDVLVVDSANMIEVGEGFYKYNFAAYDQLKDYTILVDAGDTLSSSDRYHYASSSDLDLSEIITKVNNIDVAVKVIEKLTGYKSIYDSNTQTLTIYEADGTTIWRQYLWTDNERTQI
jgi:hypothetical protein